MFSDSFPYSGHWSININGSYILSKIVPLPFCTCSGTFKSARLPWTADGLFTVFVPALNERIQLTTMVQFYSYCYRMFWGC